MKRLMLITGIVMAMLLAGGNASAQNVDNDFEKAVAEYMEVTQAKSIMINTLVQTYRQMNLPFTDVDKMTKELVDTIWDKYIKAEAKIMREYFTLDEVRDIVAFYRTPVGKKFAENSSEVAVKTAQILMGQEFQGPIQQVLMKYVK